MNEVTSRIAWLESQIDKVEHLNKKYTDRISSGEATFADKLSAQSNESLIRGYKTELRREKELFRK